VLKYNAYQSLVFHIFPSASNGKSGRRGKEAEVTLTYQCSYLEPQRKNFFDIHVPTMAEGMMETRLNVNGTLLRVSKSTFCCLQNFICSLEENPV